MTDVPAPSLADVPKAVATPCIKVCIIDGQSSLCLGCYRTLHEVATWGRMTDEERAQIMAGLRERRARIAPEKLGLA